MNKASIAKLASKNETTRGVFVFLSMRDRNSTITNLPIVRSALKSLGINVNRKDFDNMWLALEKEGVGKVLYSPRNKVKKFQWIVPVKEVAKIGAKPIVEKKEANEKLQDMVTVTIPRSEYETIKKSLSILENARQAS